MPGSVPNASPVTVMPNSLSRAFARAQEYIVLENDYKNGESQRGKLTETSRKQWQIGKRLSPTALDALRDFYEARKGPTEPFYFYDLFETSPPFTHDPTGVATAGRYTVRFERRWTQAANMARLDAEIALVELA